MGFFKSFARRPTRTDLVPLYTAIVAEARRRDWYTDAGVPDTIDGRFDMVVLILSLVLLRLEAEGENARLPSVLLTELFIEDMDGTMREIGFGDLVVGKRIGGIMSALGGRLGAYRSANRQEALVRNLYRGVEPPVKTLQSALSMTNALEQGLAGLDFAIVSAGRLA